MNRVIALDSWPARQVGSQRHVRLGMAELAPNGLSEQWLLRFGGDIHWSLIAEGMGQAQAVFQDLDGRPVYAAFCTTSLDMCGENLDLLGKDVSVASELYGVGKAKIGSMHSIHLGGKLIACLDMISTFVSHDDTGSNRRIIRNQNMPPFTLPPAPRTLVDLGESSRATARKSASTTLGTKVFEARPCPSLDFNAVGLLYFPTFSKFAEMAEFSNGDASSLTRREVTYLGNVDRTDTISVFRSGSLLTMTRDDGKTIAVVTTSRT